MVVVEMVAMVVRPRVDEGCGGTYHNATFAASHCSAQICLRTLNTQPREQERGAHQPCTSTRPSALR